MLKPRWNLRTQIAALTVASIYLAIVSYLKVPLDLALPFVASPVLLLTIIYERQMPQWVSLIIAAACISILFTCLLLPEVH